MKAVILAGGRGTRLSELTHRIPKPMALVGGTPILHHIMRIYARAGVSEFVVALGHKGEVIKEYFKNLRWSESNMRVRTGSGETTCLSPPREDWDVMLIDTGQDAMTGGRLLALRDFLNETFFLTYGDGLANVDLAGLLAEHKERKVLASISVSQDHSRFGKVTTDQNGYVTAFLEKQEATESLVNIGFMALEPEVIDSIGGPETILETDVLPRLAANGELSAFRHHGFFHTLDNLRDQESLDKLAQLIPRPWEVPL